MSSKPQFDPLGEDSDVAVWAMAEIQRLAYRLRQLRQARGWSLEDVGRKIGLARQEVFRAEAPVEHGMRSLPTLQLIALRLGHRVKIELVPLETEPAEAEFDKEGHWLGSPQPDYVDDVIVREELSKPPHEMDLTKMARQLADRSLLDIMEDFELSETEAEDLFRRMGIPPKTFRNLPPRRKGNLEAPEF
jgi:transcriptional regulator with XRE-family HTH domain